MREGEWRRNANKLDVIKHREISEIKFREKKNMKQQKVLYYRLVHVGETFACNFGQGVENDFGYVAARKREIHRLAQIFCLFVCFCISWEVKNRNVLRE